MIQRYHNEPVGLRVMPEPGDYLKLHDRILPDGSEQITVGRGGSWSVLACKEVYGKASKAVQASGAKSAVFDLSAAAELGRDGLLAAAEGICGGAYQMKYTLSDHWEPEFACYASGEGWQEQDLQLGWTLAESILRTRSLVNRPANLLTPERLAAALTEQCAGLRSKRSAMTAAPCTSWGWRPSSPWATAAATRRCWPCCAIRARRIRPSASALSARA